jgi:predicted phage-related endonuclease
MEDKTFELLSKLYGEFSEFRKETNTRLNSLENGQKKIESLIENDVKEDIKALYDGYKQTYEKLESVEIKVNDISSKVEKQDVEIRVIKGGK